MSAFESDRPARRFPATISLLVIIAIVLIGGGYYLAPRFEWKSPQIRLPEGDVIGLAPMEIDATDQGAGLKSVAATLSVGGTEHPLERVFFADRNHGWAVGFGGTVVSYLRNDMSARRITPWTRDDCPSCSASPAWPTAQKHDTRARDAFAMMARHPRVCARNERRLNAVR